ncbi:MAG TPA: putative PEP-binding protein [Ktedonobacteraceae bacterium]
MLDATSSDQQPLRVLPISPGIALGPIRLLDRIEESRVPQPERSHIQAEQLTGERQILQQALATAEVELNDLYERVTDTVGQAEAEIFTAQKFMLRDPDLLDEVEALMARQFFSATSAWRLAIEQQSELLAALPDATLSARAADVRDMGTRVLSHLQAIVSGTSSSKQSASVRQVPALIVARDLTPSQTARLDPASILGICTVEGGPTTHAAIIARALEIPAIAGLDAQVLASLREGQQLAIDGGRGLVYLHFDDMQRSQLAAAMAEQQSKKNARDIAYWRTRPGETADGHTVPIYANVGDVAGAREAAEQGAQGIGLLRTEFLLAQYPSMPEDGVRFSGEISTQSMDLLAGQRITFPDEQEQFASYRELFQNFASQALFHKTIVARTLDVGADKPFPALERMLGEWKETNPALGLRGARIHLLHTELLRQQIRALLRAAGETAIDLRIMFPMIATVEETRRMKQVLEEARAELSQAGVAQPQNVAVGIMIETPAAVWLADALAREVDFFSIGANDLFQYTLAADRTNSRVMGMFAGLEPALWRSINHVLQAARIHEIPVAVCGEIAADPRYGPLLVGLGIDELSVSPPALARVKEALHQHDLSYWQSKAQALLQAETAAEIEELL